MTLPMPNTARILARKKKRIRNIWIWALCLCLFFILFFLLTLRIEPPGTFALAIGSLAAVPVLLFAAVMLYLHVKLFPEFDYGSLTPEEIRALPVSQKFFRERRRVRWRKILHFSMVVLCAVLGVLPVVLGRPAKGEALYTLRRILYSMEFLPALGLVLSTRFLTWDVKLRRQLELVKYTIK